MFGLECAISALSLCGSLDGLISLTGQGVGRMSGQCPSERKRKELLIILVTTGGRHTQDFLWESNVPGYQHWVCPRENTCYTGRVGPWTVLKSPSYPHRIDYVYSKVSTQHYTQTHINNLPLLWTISRI